MHSGVQAASGGLLLGVPITELALLNTFTLLLWQLKAVQQDQGSEAAGQSSTDPAVALGERVLTFCVQLESIFETSEDLQRLQDCIFRIQADLFLVFSANKLNVCGRSLHLLSCCLLLFCPRFDCEPSGVVKRFMDPGCATASVCLLLACIQNPQPVVVLLSISRSITHAFLVVPQ